MSGTVKHYSSSENFDRQAAVEAFESIQPAINNKEILDDMYDHIMAALMKGTSVRGVWNVLRKNGFTGSLQMVQNWVARHEKEEEEARSVRV